MIRSIFDGAMQFFAQILDWKIMRKCHADEVSTLVVYLAALCSKGVQYNWAKYLCHDFSEDYHKA